MRASSQGSALVLWNLVLAVVLSPIGARAAGHTGVFPDRSGPTAVGTCCCQDGSCTLVDSTLCPAGCGFSAGGSCVPDPCRQPGACCQPCGTCTFVFESGCIWPDLWSAGFPCSPSPCPAYMGACCDFASGTCSLTAPCGGCPGEFLGPGSTCFPNPCPAPGTGACCFESDNALVCIVTTLASCNTIPGSTWQALACSPDACVVPTRVATWGRIKAGYRPR